ncbi:MAG: TCR/Tet family MFS transporter, partial [Pseudomonadota bacterium]
MVTRPPSKHATFFILIVVCLDSVGIGLIMPVMPALITELTDQPVSDAARWGGFLMFLYALMQFSFGPTLGNLSDRFGRRPVLLVSVFMLAIDYLIMALAPTLALLVVGRLLSGIAAATHSTANAVMADISTPEKRAQNFGLVGAAFGVGFIIGPLIGGLLGEFGPRAPFYAAAAISFANFLYGLFILPETLTEKNRRPFEWSRANPIGTAKQIGNFPSVVWFVVVYFFMQMAFFTYPSTWSYFTIESFGWTSARVGLSLAAVGIGFALVQGWLIRPILARLGEANTAILGLTASGIALTGFALSPNEWLLWSFVPICSLGIIA